MGAFPSKKSSKWVPSSSTRFGQRTTEDVELFVDGESYFDSVAEYIEKSTKFIHILDWSFHPEAFLRPNLQIGPLLLKKASEGVSVLLHIWRVPKVIEDSGTVVTYATLTKEYFEGTPVEVLLSQPVDGSTLLSVDLHRSSTRKTIWNLVNFLTSDEMLFSHHTKCVICDVHESFNATVPVVAFCGGFDLTLGRWDTPEHPLFDFHECQHFYNAECDAISDEDPRIWCRQPWHDVGCKIIGMGCIDLLENFEERWRVGAVSNAQKWLRIPFLDSVWAEISSFANLADIDIEVSPQNNNNSSNNSNKGSKKLLHIGRNPQDHHAKYQLAVQLFRSIAHHSILDDPIERDIELAYLNAIKNAERFLYLENQFFFGSSDRWHDGFFPAAERLFWEGRIRNRIPGAIIDRINNAIRDCEDFCVYVVIPMYPEGDPSSVPIHDMLHNVFRTISCMYSEISIALANKKRKIVGKVEDARIPGEIELLSKTILDYLGFYCLGKVERDADVESRFALLGKDGVKPSPKGRLLLRTKRYPIYVHSKMCIADDEFVLLGSANINDRSLLGDRDTEIVVGIEDISRCEVVQKMRHDLWTNHLGLISSSSNNEKDAAAADIPPMHPLLAVCPSSPHCKREIDRMACANWRVYVHDGCNNNNSNEIISFGSGTNAASPSRLPFGHLMPYPVRVDVLHGSVSPIDLCDCGSISSDGIDLAGVGAVVLPQDVTA